MAQLKILTCREVLSETALPIPLKVYTLIVEGHLDTDAGPWATAQILQFDADEWVQIIGNLDAMFCQAQTRAINEHELCEGET